MLLVKLGLIALTLLAALLAWHAFTRSKGVRPQLALELTLLVAVLGLTATLSQTAPPTHNAGQLHGESH